MKPANIQIKTQIGKYYIIDKTISKSSLSSTNLGCPIEDTFRLCVIRTFEKSLFIESQLTNALDSIKTTQLYLSVAPLNVVKMLDFMQTKSHIYIVEEYCNGISFDQYLQKKGRRLSENETILILGELSQAFRWFHERLIIHSALYPSNIMINDNYIKVSLSWSSILSPFLSQPLEISKENRFFIAPECLESEKNLSSKVDVWSFGILGYYMMYGISPSTHVNSEETKEHIHLTRLLKDEEESEKIQFPKEPKYDEKMKSLIAQMLIRNPEARISWEQISESGFFTGKDQVNNEENPNSPSLSDKKDRIIRVYRFLKDYLKKNRVLSEIREAVGSDGTSPKSPQKVAKIKGIFDSKKAKYARKLDNYLSFERNIAVFYSWFAVQLFSIVERGNFDEMPNDFYLRVIHCLVKYSTISLMKVVEAIRSKKVIMPLEKYDAWELYFQSGFYESTTKNVQKALEFVSVFMEEIEQKTQKGLENVIKTEKKQSICDLCKNFLERFVEARSSEEILVELKELEKEIPETFAPFLQKMSQEKFAFIKFLHVAAHPYRFFKWNKKEWESEIDFERFYQENECAKSSILCNEVIEIWSNIKI